MQPSLFDALPITSQTPEPEHIDVVDGRLSLWRHWLAPQEQSTLLDVLQRELAWEQSHIRLFGKRVAIPRLNAWYADPGCEYGYSGHRLTRHEWHPLLANVRDRLLAQGLRVNSVLANWYRDGNDSNGWHSDDEPELGENPLIASVSLGVGREFQLRHKRRAQAPVKLMLTSGSLLVMSGELQHHWQHSLPKRRGVSQGRINLTFRYIARHTDAYTEGYR